MDDVARPERLTTQIRLPLIGAIAGGGLVALAFLLMPSAMLEDMVLASGIPAILAAAEPPLGFTARIALGLVFGGLTAGFAWFGLGLLPEERPLEIPRWSYQFDMSKWTALLRREAKTADGAPRPPLFAGRELGTPFLDVKAPAAQPQPEYIGPPPERDLPLDLDQPLAAFDPGAVPAEPMTPSEPVEPLVRPQLIDPGDRFETFELTPMQRIDPPSLRAAPAEHSAPAPAPEDTRPVVAPQTETTVHALLARLERGLSGSAAIPAATAVPAEPAPEIPSEPASEPMPEPAPAIRPGSLQDTLSDLRRLATGSA